MIPAVGVAVVVVSSFPRTRGDDPERAKLVREAGRALIERWRALKTRELELLRELADLNVDPGARREYLIARENEAHRLQGRAARATLDAEKRRIAETPVATGDALLANTRAIGHVTVESRESYIRRKMAENGWDRQAAIAQATHLYPEDMADLRAPWANSQLYTGEGGHSPDTAAQALYDEGRLADPTVDAFWDAVRGDIETIGKAKRRELDAAEAEAAAALAWGKERHDQTLAAIELQDDAVGLGLGEARSSIGGFGLSERARDEMEKVRRQYEGTDQWMKAPNGQPTKLTRRQWLLVRTPAFKRWFGDWENDPTNASKVVDENGEPLVVYHGSENAGFTVFDSDYWDEGMLGNFASSGWDVASTYSGVGIFKGDPDIVLPVRGPALNSEEEADLRPGNYALFLNIRNPLIVDAQGHNWNDIPAEGKDDYVEAIDLTDEQLLSLKEDAWPPIDIELEYDEDGNLEGWSHLELAEAIEASYVQEELDEDENVIGTDTPLFHKETLETTTANQLIQSTRDIANWALRDGSGWDGVIFRNVIDMGQYSGGWLRRESDVFVTKEGVQLKSAVRNTGNFDPENPDIRSSISGPLPTVKRIRGLSNERSSKTILSIIPFAGNKTAIVNKHQRFFAELAEFARASGGRIVDAFAGIGGYTSSIGRVTELPEGSALNEWSIARYTMHKAIAEDPEAVSDAVRDIIGRLAESEEATAFYAGLREARREEDETQKRAKRNSALDRLVQWFNDELNGRHGVTYVAAPGNSSYGDAQLNEDAQTAGLYVVLQTLASMSRPINFIWDDKTGTAKIDIAGQKFTRYALSMSTVYNDTYRPIAKVFKPEGYTDRIGELGGIYTRAKLTVTRRDGWEVAREAKPGDVVLVDPAYLGVQAYGGSKNSKTSIDANNVQEAIQKLADLAKTAIENGFSIVYTNEFSDKSKKKKPGFSQIQYARIWNEAMRRIGRDNASIAYITRGKAGGSADIVIVAGEARKVLDRAIKRTRRDNNPRTQTRLYASAPGTTTIANPGAEVNTEVDPRETSARQKDAHGIYPDASVDIARASIGGRRQAEYRGLIAKHRPNLPQAEVDRFMAELDKLGDTKAEKAALHWFVKGALELPEDNDKLKQALSLAERFKLDPLQFDSPTALSREADKRNPKKRKVRYIDPDTVPELTNRRDLGNGLVIYDVEDSEAGQAAMRRIMNSHLGRNADGEYWSPWCLLTPTDAGDVSESAKRYWGQYDKSGRGAAFYKGKLVAFQSSKFPQGPEWWDMDDNSHRGWVPYAKEVPAHEAGWDDVPAEAVVMVTKEANQETGEHRDAGEIPLRATVGDKQNGLWQLWGLGPTSHYLKEQATYKNGKLDGTRVTFHQTPRNGPTEPSRIYLTGYELYKDGELSESVYFDEDGTTSSRTQEVGGRTVTVKYWRGEPEAVAIKIDKNTREEMEISSRGYPDYVRTTNGQKAVRENWHLNNVAYVDIAFLGKDGLITSKRILQNDTTAREDLAASARKHGVPLPQRTLDRLDAFQRGDLEALRIKDPLEGVPLPDVSSFVQGQGGARSSIGGRETLRLPRETEAEVQDPRSSIGGIENGAQAASLYFGRAPTYRDLNAKSLAEVALFATGKKQTRQKVAEAYASFGVSVTPETAAVIADRINADLEEQRNARRSRLKPGEQPRDRAFGLVDALAKAYDANWAEAQKEAFSKGVAGTFGAAREMAEDIQTLMEARRQEAEAVTGTAPAVLETEMGFDIEATLLAAPEPSPRATGRRRRSPRHFTRTLSSCEMVQTSRPTTRACESCMTRRRLSLAGRIGRGDGMDSEKTSEQRGHRVYSLELLALEEARQRSANTASTALPRTRDLTSTVAKLGGEVNPSPNKKSQEGRRNELANAPQVVRSWHRYYRKTRAGKSTLKVACA